MEKIGCFLGGAIIGAFAMAIGATMDIMENKSNFYKSLDASYCVTDKKIKENIEFWRMEQSHE